jgi:hypothetical protein
METQIAKQWQNFIKEKGGERVRGSTTRGKAVGSCQVAQKHRSLCLKTNL